MLSSGLCSDRKYERKEWACSSIRNAIRAGFLAFAVYLPETATSELSVGDRSRLVVSPRRAHAKMLLCVFPCCLSVRCSCRKYHAKSGLVAGSFRPRPDRVLPAQQAQLPHRRKWKEAVGIQVFSPNCNLLRPVGRRCGIPACMRLSNAAVDLLLYRWYDSGNTKLPEIHLQLPSVRSFGLDWAYIPFGKSDQEAQRMWARHT